MENGTDDELVQFCYLLKKLGISHFIDLINEELLVEITSSMIFQYSNFDAGTRKLIKLLYIEKKELTFDEIGRQLLGERSNFAEKKYGENHSKLAEAFSLVSISSRKPLYVKNTNFGNFCVSIDSDCLGEILKILVLRNELIQRLIIKSKKGLVYYTDEVSCISKSTQYRRRLNVKFLIDYILNGTFHEQLKNNIIW